MVLTVALVLIVGALSAIYLWFQRNHSYWQRKGIPYVQPTPIIGNTGPVFTQSNMFGLHISEIYSDPKMQDEAAVGIYVMNQPALVIREPELIKSVLIKDFNRFSNRYGRSDPHGDALGSNNLFFVRNPEWKEIRNKLTPVFTSGKLKQMYPLMQEVADDLEELLVRETSKDANNVMDIKDTCARFTTDLIATTAFGVRANSLANPDAEFRKQGSKVFQSTLTRSKDFFIAFFVPKLVSLFRTKLFSKDFSNFMRTTINHVIAERERSGTVRNDLIDVFVGLRKEAAQQPDKPHIANKKDFLVGQAGVFFTAGYETSSSAMTFSLFELAKQPELQDRLRKEINAALIEEGTGKLSYEKIQSLEYLSMVVDEVLRMYPTLPFLDREYQSIKGQPDFSLKPYYDFKLENGTPVFIPVYGLQRDPKYWSNPNHFDPERFSPENRKKIETVAYQPFGLGPHNCIGSRIGLLQAKLGLVHILKNYNVRSCSQTVKEMKFNPNFPVLQLKTGMFLELVHDRLYDVKAGEGM